MTQKTMKQEKETETYSPEKCVLEMSLANAKQAIGAVNLVRYRQQKPFSSDEQQLLSSLAGEVSEFIEQAQLLEQRFEAA